MKFTAKLITDRKLERDVVKFAPDQVNAEGLATEFLNNGCVPGDLFDIYETRQVLVSTLRLNAKKEVDRIEWPNK